MFSKHFSQLLLSSLLKFDYVILTQFLDFFFFLSESVAEDCCEVALQADDMLLSDVMDSCDICRVSPPLPWLGESPDGIQIYKIETYTQ